jgi:CheY-like chemotaxis protein
VESRIEVSDGAVEYRQTVDSTYLVRRALEWSGRRTLKAQCRAAWAGKKSRCGRQPAFSEGARAQLRLIDMKSSSLWASSPESGRPVCHCILMDLVMPGMDGVGPAGLSRRASGKISPSSC